MNNVSGGRAVVSTSCVLPGPCRAAMVNGCRFAACASAGLLVHVTAVHAGCTWANGQTTHDYTFAIPTLAIPRDATVGTVLYSPPRQAAIPADTVYANCSGNTPVVRKVTGGTQVSTNPYTYATNVAGVGMRFFDYYSSKRYWGAGSQEFYNGPWTWNDTTLGVEVVVTGPVGSGTLNATLVGTMLLGSLTIANLRVTTAIVTVSTCQVDTALAVVLPAVVVSNLPSNGSTAGSTPVAITLTNCPAGMTSIQYRLDSPDGAVNASSGVFSVNRGSSAQGIALSVTDATQTPVSLGVLHAVTAYSSKTGGTYPINLAIRYYRTGTIAPGTVKGSLMYTMSYQ
jgi:major type 1 subunit fimbrin (pilin)